MGKYKAKKRLLTKVITGDRFQDTSGVWEITEIINGVEWSICISGSYKGLKDWHQFSNNDHWTYLGNFAKDTSFNELYNLFNGE